MPNTSFSRQGALLFLPPRNATFTLTTNTLTIDISEAGQASTFDWLYLKCKGATAIAVTGDGTAIGSFDIPTEQEIPHAYPAIENVNITRHGWQHIHHEFLTEQTASELVITITGTNIDVTEVFILKIAHELEQFTRLDQGKINEAIVTEFLTGERYCASTQEENTLRWQSQCTHECTPDTVSAAGLAAWFSENPEIVFAPDVFLSPWQIYKALVEDTQIDADYLTPIRTVGQSVSFAITQSEPNTPAGIDTFTTGADGEILFFKDCIHLRQHGAIDDNDYKTQSTETTATINTENTEITHIWIRGRGITAIALQTEIGGVWTTQNTLTPTWTSLSDIDYSLTPLTTPITASEIRLLITTGVNPTYYNISELMLLTFAGSLKSMLEHGITYSDRGALLKKSSGGFIKGRSRLGTQRLKRENAITCYFDFNEHQTLEDFWDWVDTHPNFVFSANATDTYPAVFENTAHLTRLYSQTRQSGTALDIRIAER